MNARLRLAAPLVAALAIAACNGGGSSNVPAVPGQSTAQTRSHSTMPEWQAKDQAAPVCPQVVGKPTCLALRVKGIIGNSSPTGLFPIDLQTAYNLPITKGSGQIVAIVDAYDNPNVASDLATYRSEFGLGTANFTKYNQEGQQGNYPGGSPDWGIEIDLDVDMVSAACPNCTIYLIEANSSDSSDLDAAEAEAVTLGAHIVSNSWISYGCNTCDNSSDFDAPGVVYTAGSGDAGYNNIGSPSVFDSVVAVGGTQLTKSGSTYSETVWDGAGAGCATGVTKPKWQKDKGCSSRTDADISSEAGCEPGVAEYDSYNDSGWTVECGTSAATPLNAAVFALAGNASTIKAPEHFWKLKKKKAKRELHYISSGNDGSCGGSYLCTAGTGQFKTYSGPAGWGTPDGIKAY